MKKNIPYILLYSYIVKNLLFNFSTLNYAHQYSGINQILSLLIALLALLYSGNIIKFTLHQYLIILIVTFVVIISFYFTQDLSIVTYFVFVLAFLDSNLRKIIKTVMLAQITGVLLIVFLFNLHIITERISTRSGILRRSFGFNHPGHISTLVLFILMEYFYIYKTKINLSHIIIGSLLMLYLNEYTDGRTAMMCFFVYIFLYCITRYINIDKFLYLLNCILPYVYLISSLYVAIFMKQNLIFAYLDNFLSGRLTFIKYFYDEYGISFFGQFLQIITTYETSLNVGLNTLVLDSFYMNLVIKYGLLFTFIFFIHLFKVNKYLYKNNESELLLLLLIVLLFSFIANIATLIEVNCIFVLGMFYLKKKKINNLKNGEIAYE